MKKSKLILTGVLVFFIISYSCQPATNQATDVNAIVPPVRTLDPALYILYIDSVTDNVTRTKFIDLNNSIQQDHDMKLVFQFLYKDNGKLTMVVYSGKKDHTLQFKNNLEVKLQIYDSCPAPDNLLNKAVYLGDLEIQNEKNRLGDINTMATKFRYIFFIPKLDPQGQKFTIDYTIFATNDFSKTVCNTISVDSSASSTLTTLSTNPSPPHAGNQ